jgi:hypothetical protein
VTIKRGTASPPLAHRDPANPGQTRFNQEVAQAIREIAPGSNVILPKPPGHGIKVDTDSPTFPWHDLIGAIRPKATGAGSPTSSAFRGGRYLAYSFAVNDQVDLDFHIPHDYLPGSDLFIHLHWSHNGTAISGTLAASWAWTYSKGHNRDDFGAEQTLTQSVSVTSIADCPQYRHRIEEIKLSTPGGGNNRLDSTIIEPDGLLLVNLRITGIPTITGGSPNRPFILFADIHYQSTCVGTKQRAPDFYV